MALKRWGVARQHNRPLHPPGQPPVTDPDSRPQRGAANEVTVALTAMGFAYNDVVEAVRDVHDGDHDIDTLLSNALHRLSAGASK